MKHWTIILMVFTALFSSKPLLARIGNSLDVAPNKYDIVFGTDLIISQDYHNTMERRLPEYQLTGGYVWLGADLGLRFKSTNNLSVTPGVALWFNYIDYGSEFGFNTIILPNISVQYQFGESPSFYIRGEFNYGIPSMDLFPGASGKLGTGSAIGYNFEVLSMEFGYLSVPVDISEDYFFGNGYSPYQKSPNMGGFLFRASLGL